MNALALSLLQPASSTPVDADVERAVRGYCRRLGDDASTTEAAVSWALRAGGNTLARIRLGHDRADQLRDRLRRNGAEVPA